jgi:hypothetical protein
MKGEVRKMENFENVSFCSPFSQFWLSHYAKFETIMIKQEMHQNSQTCFLLLSLPEHAVA